MGRKAAILISGTVLLAGTAGFLVYRSKRNQAEGEALLALLGSSKVLDETNATKAANDEIKDVKAFKLDPNRIRIGKLYGKLTDPAIKDLFAKTNVAIWAAMKGGGTDKDAFLMALANLKSKNSLAFMDKIFKAQYKEGLFEMMMGESALNSKQYCAASEKTNTMLRQLFPLFGTACWVPWLGAWMHQLPEY